MSTANNMTANPVKSTRLGGKTWTSAIIFGLIGQVAWVVENMYFAKFAQDIFDAPQYGDFYYVATTLMVIFSAITATVTTIFAGGLCDRTGTRKPFIAIGYIFWGLTIMMFALVPINFDPEKGGLIIALLVFFDCVMTLAGSTANDAAFNSWVTDVTDVTNRGKVNTILSVMPVIATVLTLGLAMFTYDKQNFKLFFIVLGVIPTVAGIMALFMLKDSPGLVKNKETKYLKQTFYGFGAKVIKKNKMMYVCLSALCLIGIAQQIFMSYLINFVEKTLGITNYLLPLAVIIVLSAAITGITGILFDKIGRKNFYIPLLLVIVAGTLLVYLMKFMSAGAYLPILYVGGTIMLGAMLCIGGALMSTFQDYIPKGYEGRFQGVRMCFTVLIPMIIGPIITLIIGINSFDAHDARATTPPFEIFLAAAVVALLAIIPIIFVRKDSQRLRNELMEQKQLSDSAAETAELSAAAAQETVLGEAQPVFGDEADAQTDESADEQ